MRHLGVALAVFFLVSSSAVDAGWIETFPGGVPQQNWTFAALPPGASFSQSYFSDGVRLESTTPVTGQPGGGAAAVFGWVDEALEFCSGVRVRAVVNPNEEEGLLQNVGVLAQLDLGTLSGYSFTIKYSTPHSIDINRIAGGTNSNLVHGPIPGFDPAAPYIVEFDAFGTRLTGRVYDMDENLLSTISAIDASPYTSGFAGIVAQREPGDPTLLGTFGMISVIPEPSSLLLAALGIVGLAAGRRMRRRRSDVAG